MSKPCTACSGSGSAVATDTVKVKIPPGASTGSKVKIRGMGSAGMYGGPAGDLYIEITVQTHPVYRREGNDLYVDVPVTINDAILGSKIKVPTLDGDVNMTLPAGTDSGKKFKLKGKGIPARKSAPRGDQYAVIKIIVPKNIDDKAREALEVLGQAYEKGEDGR